MPDTSLAKITKNSNASIENLQIDAENLCCQDDFVKAAKKPQRAKKRPREEAQDIKQLARTFINEEAIGKIMRSLLFEV